MNGYNTYIMGASLLRNTFARMYSS